MEAGKVKIRDDMDARDNQVNPPTIVNSQEHESANPGFKRIRDNVATPTVVDAKSFMCLSQLATKTIGATVKHALQAVRFTHQELRVPAQSTEALHVMQGLRNQAMKNMAKMNPPTYDGTGEPMMVYNWLNRMEKLLSVIACPDHVKEVVASLYLMDEVSDWWDLERPNVDVVPWTTFRARLEGHYCPLHVSEVKRTEFLYPDNDGLQVSQLSKKFNELVRYAGPLVQTEEDKIKYFHGWMRPELKSLLVNHGCTTLGQYVVEARKVETAYEKLSLAINTRRAQAEKLLGIKKRSAPSDESGQLSQVKRTKKLKKASVQSSKIVVKTIQCHNCKDTSHIKPNCTQPLRTCRGCRKKGHMMEFCHATAQKQKEAVESFTGHMVKFCRTKAQKEKEALESFTGR